MTTVGRLLGGKGHDLWTVAPDASVYDAIALMAERGIGALPVVEDGRLAGILSERDYARKVILKGRSSKETRVSEIMTSEVVTVAPDQTIDRCMQLMTERRIRHLPVVEDGRLTGMLSIGDVVKYIISDREHTIEKLESYITGGR
jgi:CBS domain-containing protein